MAGLGNSESEDVSGMALDTALGAGIGLGAGKIAEKASPYIQKGTDAAGKAYQNAKQAVGEKTKNLAENLAFKSSGAMLKDFRSTGGRGKINELGRHILNSGLKIGDSIDDISARSLSQKGAAGEKLDEIYGKAAELFKERLGSTGFDPLRDKNEILKAAQKELGNTVGAESALNKLAGYLDEVAARHGDDPMQSAMSKFNKEMDEFTPKQEQFLRDKASYQSQLGAAGDDLDQMALPVFADDFQRASTSPRQIEIHGKDASKMSASQSELGHQMGLTPLPQRQPNLFNQARGDDLLPMQQQMALDELGTNMMLQNGQQGFIDGLELVPRAFQNVDDMAIASGRGQMQFPISPKAPNQPIMPSEIRNPMGPRATNDIKSALDDQINYSRNPLTKEPSAEIAFSAARNKILQNVENQMDSLGGGKLVDELRAANKEYGNSTQVSKMAKDRVDRQNANKMAGLTDTITGSASAIYGFTTGDWKTAVGIMAAKKGFEKFGTSGFAVAADKISKRLLAAPQMQKLAEKSPKAFQAIVYQLEKRMSAERVLSRAASNKEENQVKLKGSEKWASDGAKKLIDHDKSIKKEMLDELMKTKKGKALLVKASATKTPGAMQKLVDQIKGGN